MPQQPEEWRVENASTETKVIEVGTAGVLFAEVRVVGVQAERAASEMFAPANINLILAHRTKQLGR
jgi:hypothetical protein